MFGRQFSFFIDHDLKFYSFVAAGAEMLLRYTLFTAIYGLFK